MSQTCRDSPAETVDGWLSHVEPPLIQAGLENNTYLKPPSLVTFSLVVAKKRPPNQQLCPGNPVSKRHQEAKNPLEILLVWTLLAAMPPILDRFIPILMDKHGTFG